MDKLKEQCGERAESQRLKDVFEECNNRVSSKENTTETCTQELFDFLHSVDHCVSFWFKLRELLLPAAPSGLCNSLDI